MELIELPQDVLGVIVFFLSPYAYGSLCLTNEYVYRTIKDMRASFMVKHDIIDADMDTPPSEKRFLSVVDFGYEYNRVDIYVNEWRVSLERIQVNSSRFEYYALYNCHAVVTNNVIVCVVLMHSGFVSYPKDLVDFDILVGIVWDQVGGDDLFSRDLCGICLLLTRGDIVKAIRKLTRI